MSSLPETPSILPVRLTRETPFHSQMGCTLLLAVLLLVFAAFAFVAGKDPGKNQWVPWVVGAMFALFGLLLLAACGFRAAVGSTKRGRDGRRSFDRTVGTGEGIDVLLHPARAGKIEIPPRQFGLHRGHTSAVAARPGRPQRPSQGGANPFHRKPDFRRTPSHFARPDLA